MKKNIMILLLIITGIMNIRAQSFVILSPSITKQKKFAIAYTSKEDGILIIAQQIKWRKKDDKIKLCFTQCILSRKTSTQKQPDLAAAEIFEMNITNKDIIFFDGLKLDIKQLQKKIEEFNFKTMKTEERQEPSPSREEYTQNANGKETLEDIAKQHGISIDKIRKMNPGLPLNRKIKKGTSVVISSKDRNPR